MRCPVLLCVALSGCGTPATQPTAEPSPTTLTADRPAPVPPATARIPAAHDPDAVGEAVRAVAQRSGPRFALVVDRPMFRPGETVWARTFDVDPSSFESTDATQDVVFRLEDPRGTVVASHRRPSTDGRATANIPLPAPLAGGRYTLVATSGKRTSRRPLLVADERPPKIRKSLDLLREAYGPGDEVSATVSVASAGGGPLPDHRLRAVMQVGSQTVPVDGVTTDANGQAVVVAQLPPGLDRSDVTLTVIVDEGGWTESISRPVPVVLDDIGVEWFPEGGDLVSGLPGRLYLRAKTTHGEPADVAGTLVDDQGTEVARFRTLHDGLGRVSFTPERGHTYHARLSAPASSAGRELPLPAPKASGCVLRAHDDPDSTHPALRVGVRCATDRPVIVAAAHRDQPLDSATVQAGPDGATVYLTSADPALDRTEGVAVVSVLDPELEPLAERLVYRNRHRGLQIRIDRPDRALSPRDDVTLTVHTTDPSGQPVPADLALSVVDDRLLKLADDEHGHLLTRLHLEPWLRGEALHDPGWYYDPDEADGPVGLDLVMGTYGWRRFRRVMAQHPRDAGEGVRARKTEGRVGQPRSILDDLQEAGLLEGILDDEIDPRILEGITGFRGHKDTQFGLGGLGVRGSGLGGGGIATGGFGSGLGTLGHGGYGTGGGDFGRRGTPVTARAGQPVISGALDRKLIHEVIRRHMSQIRYCYQREVTKNPGLAGTVTARFTIAPDGSVASASIKSSTLGSPRVEHCLVGRFMRMRFPAPRGAGNVQVTYPFTFTTETVRGRAPQAPRYDTVREFPLPDYRTARTPASRTDFRSTVMWAPHLTTDDHGVGTVTFPLSDAVTTFRVIAQGIGGGHAGRAEVELPSTLPFALDVPLPEQLSFGDRLVLPVRLTNRRDRAASVTLTSTIDGPLEVEDGTDQQGLTVPAQQGLTAHVPLTVPPRWGTAQIAIEAQQGSLRDAVTQSIEVVPAGFPVEWSASGTLAGTVTHEVTIDDLRGTPAKGHLTISTSPLSVLLDGIEDIVRMPGGCFEQTSSSNYPNVLVLRHLDRIGRAAAVRVDRAHALRSGYQRLVGYQVDSGGFETFGRGPGKEVLSAYGLLQFTDMRSVWPTVDAGMLGRNVSFLLAARQSDGGYRSSGLSSHQYGGAPDSLNDAFITWALVETGEPDLGPQLAATQALARTTSDPYELALAALTLQHTHERAARSAVERLVGMQAADGSIPGASVTVVGTRGRGVTVETTALVALALLRDGAHVDAATRATGWLLQQRGPRGWGSTQATVLALKALDALATEAPSDAGGTATVVIDGATVATLTWTGDEQHPLEVDLSPWLTPGTHRITLRSSEGAAPYTVEGHWAQSTPPDGDDAPLALSTTLSTHTTDLARPVRLDVRVQNTTDHGVSSPVARIGLPAGTRVDPTQLDRLRDEGRIAYFETRPREITLYWEGFTAGEVQDIGLDLTPRVPGRFTAPASSAYPYYDPERVRWAEGARLTVR